MRLGFLATRNGSSFRAIVEAAGSSLLKVDPKLLVTNTRAAAALEFARTKGIDAMVIPTQSDPASADRRLAQVMAEAKVDLIILSGYLRRLGPITLSRFQNRILNVHPGPLPKFGGEGMYGRAVHEAVLRARLDFTEITIHLVDEHYDHGAIMVRSKVAIIPGETAEDLEGRVTALEPDLFVATLRRIVSGELRLPD